jgi:hypothetical protein
VWLWVDHRCLHGSLYPRLKQSWFCRQLCLWLRLALTDAACPNPPCMADFASIVSLSAVPSSV